MAQFTGWWDSEPSIGWLRDTDYRLWVRLDEKIGHAMQSIRREQREIEELDTHLAAARKHLRRYLEPRPAVAAAGAAVEPARERAGRAERVRDRVVVPTA